MTTTNELLNQIDSLLGLHTNNALTAPIPYLAKVLLEKSAEHIRAQAAELERGKAAAAPAQVAQDPVSRDEILEMAAPHAAEQPDSVKVPRELLDQAATWLEVHAPGGGCIEGSVASDLRALLAGGEA